MRPECHHAAPFLPPVPPADPVGDRLSAALPGLRRRGRRVVRFLAGNRPLA